MLRLFCHEIDYDNLEFSENAKEIFGVDHNYYTYPYNSLEELDSGGLVIYYYALLNENVYLGARVLG